mmetsp:Transcript_28997/g.85778  ORF Transcript_28997/g.85778 Transcript_28997/m.85778 type:complete len:217 (-) Transcript_28997:1067-1717(-)
MAQGENMIEGKIPSSLGNAPNLEYLGLWDMNLNSTIPPSLFEGGRLLAAGFGKNSLTGTLPPIANSVRDSLRALGFERNMLTGSIPSSYGNLVALELLLVHSNSLEGKIPTELGNNVALRVLDLANNRLNGSIPEKFSQLVNLEWLNLANNDLTGSAEALCELNVNFGIQADCGGGEPKIECDCCAVCCESKVGSCGLNLDTSVLIKVYCNGEKDC